MFPLTRPTLSKSEVWNFFIGNLPSLFFFFFSFCSKFCILDSFCQKIDIYRLPSTSFVVQKKKPTYLPTFKIVGRGRGNRNIFNCGLRAISEKIYGWGGWKTLFINPPTIQISAYFQLQLPTTPVLIYKVPSNPIHFFMNNPSYHKFCCNTVVFACSIIARSQCWLFALGAKYLYFPPNSTSGNCAVVSKIICESTRKDMHKIVFQSN